MIDQVAALLADPLTILLVGLGTVVGMLLGLLASRLLNRRTVLPVRPYPDETEQEPAADQHLPRLAASLVPIVLPLALIAAHSLLSAVAGGGNDGPSRSGPLAAAAVMAVLGLAGMVVTSVAA